jgi:polar amino acid transport system permease protein
VTCNEGGRARSAGGTEGTGKNPEGPRRLRAAAPPKDVRGWAVAALIAAVVVMAASWGTLLDVRGVLLALQSDSLPADAVLVLLGLAAALPIGPGTRSLRLAGRVKRALAGGDLIAARVAAAASRDLAWTALGYAGAQALLVMVVQFVIINNLAVGRTFFLLPLIASSFSLILKASWINVYIFLVAEVLVLIWGLVIAVARMAPGPAGRPIRQIATFYVDVFRGLPAIINIYLIGFGLPLTGLPILKNLSQESLAILALTLTNGAYVAEIYRAGIESIHWSQTAAARSLGLSYMQTLRFVIIPQGVRHIIPPLLNTFISLQKDTALVNVIGAIDAFNQSIIIASNHFNLSAVTTVAILFVIITIPQARFVDRLIERDRQRRGVGVS